MSGLATAEVWPVIYSPFGLPHRGQATDLYVLAVSSSKRREMTLTDRDELLEAVRAAVKDIESVCEVAWDAAGVKIRHLRTAHKKERELLTKVADVINSRLGTSYAAPLHYSRLCYIRYYGQRLGDTPLSKVMKIYPALAAVITS